MRARAIAIAWWWRRVAMFVAYLSNFDSLQRTVAAYYDRQRFADVFASVKRAPLSLADPHRVAARRGRGGDARGGRRDPRRARAAGAAVGRLVSLPARGAPRLNEPSCGRGVDRARKADEVLASEMFVEAHRMQPAPGWGRW